MSAGLGRGLSGVAGRARDFLIEPATPLPVLRPARPTPTVAVIGLIPRVGATTVARAIARRLALETDEAAVVWHPLSAAGPSRPGRASGLLRRRAAPPFEQVRAAGPLLLGAGGDPARARDWACGAALVLDVPPGDLCHLAASLADAVVLVAGPGTLAALAGAVRASLGSVAAAPQVVENMVEPDRGLGSWPVVPRSSVGARLARAGLAVPGAFGAAIAEVAEGLALATQ